MVLEVVECAGCGEASSQGASVCAGCGGPLEIVAPEQHPRILHPVFGCTCGGCWTCTACCIYLFDNNLPLDAF